METITPTTRTRLRTVTFPGMAIISAQLTSLPACVANATLSSPGGCPCIMRSMAPRSATFMYGSTNVAASGVPSISCADRPVAAQPPPPPQQSVELPQGSWVTRHAQHRPRQRRRRGSCVRPRLSGAPLFSVPHPGASPSLLRIRAYWLLLLRRRRRARPLKQTAKLETNGAADSLRQVNHVPAN
jgi:hypothetical protein